jgi:DNA-directed RNA polymerase specialized sigma24 family protein
MPAVDPYGPVTDQPTTDAARAAFRELHGRHLHGFALLLTLGDTREAWRLTDDALADGTRELDALRHPERAAAWLRRRVVMGSRRSPQAPGPSADFDLAELGADPAVVAGLAALDRRERAAIIASEIERLDTRDVATIVGREGGSLDRLLRSARARFLAAHAASATEPVAVVGGLAERVRTVARQAMQ